MTLRKTLRARRRINNKLNPHVIPGLKIQREPSWRELRSERYHDRAIPAPLNPVLN